MADILLGGGIFVDLNDEKAAVQMLLQMNTNLGGNFLDKVNRAPGDEFAPVDPRALAKIATLPAEAATNLLPHAARSSCAPVIQALVDRGADLNAYSLERGCLTTGGAPLAIVAKKARHKVIELMLNLGADADATDATGWTALHIVCHRASRYYWNGGEKSKADAPKELRDHCATMHGSELESARVLIRAGADPLLQTAAQAGATSRLYAGRFFAHDLLVDERGAPLPGCGDVLALLRAAISGRGGLPSPEAQALAAAQNRALHRAAAADAVENGGDPTYRAGCTSYLHDRVLVNELRGGGEKAEKAVHKALRSDAKRLGRQFVCDYCGKHSNAKLSACSRCKFTFYCGRECQRAAWPAHKADCGKALERVCDDFEKRPGAIKASDELRKAIENDRADAARARES